MDASKQQSTTTFHEYLVAKNRQSSRTIKFPNYSSANSTANTNTAEEQNVSIPTL